MGRTVEQLGQLAQGGCPQGIRARAQELLAVERRPQANHPQATRQAAGVAQHGGPYLALDQVASDSSLRMPLGHHQAQPLPGLIHSRRSRWGLACG